MFSHPQIYLSRALQNPDSLATRVFKGRYFPNSHVLKAEKEQGSSFLWSGIWSAKEELAAGFRWVLGNGNDIVATKDPWLRSKENFWVAQSLLYEGRSDVVSSLFSPHEKKWNTSLIRSHFLPQDANAILALYIPQCVVNDKVVWANSSNGLYTAKATYHFSYESNFGTNTIPQCTG